jgi:hypothetical protein
MSWLWEFRPGLPIHRATRLGHLSRRLSDVLILCVPLRLCGYCFYTSTYRRDAEERRDCAEKSSF